jgi:hypothetical protein
MRLTYNAISTATFWHSLLGSNDTFAMDNKTSLERAFELAMSGQCASVKAIKLQLLDEGYSTYQIGKAPVLNQLKEIIKNRRSLSSQMREAGAQER